MFGKNSLFDLFGSGLPYGLTIVVIILALAATVAAYILIMPEKKRSQLSGAAALLHDVFQFKSFLLEKIVKFLYVFFTILFVILGFFTLFKSFGSGLLLMLLGPIVLRLVFETFMLTIMLVKNVIEINRKLGGANAEPRETQIFRSQPAPRPVAAETKTCPSCGREISKSAGFCKYCGSRLEQE